MTMATVIVVQHGLNFDPETHAGWRWPWQAAAVPADVADDTVEAVMMMAVTWISLSGFVSGAVCWQVQ